MPWTRAMQDSAFDYVQAAGLFGMIYRDDRRNMFTVSDV